jgi:hypothetical protein
MIMSGSLTEPDLEAARSVLEGQIGGQGRGWKIVRVDERHLCCALPSAIPEWAGILYLT